MAPVLIVLIIAAAILTPQFLRYRERARVHDLLRLAFERGQPVPPELIAVLQGPPLSAESIAALRGSPATSTVRTEVAPERSQRDLRRGVIWLAIGLGFVAVGAAFYAGLYNVGGSEETFGSFAALGAVPACIGLAFLGLWFFNRGRERI